MTTALPASVEADVYYRETERLLQAVTGAVGAVIFDHTLRLGVPEHDEPGVREPVRRVHNDQTFVSAPRRVRDHLPPAEAEERLRQRFATINVWKPIGSTVRSTPLALCDARTIEGDELIAADPTPPADAPPRRSIELRTLVFFDS
jgi:hypothetical protein